LIPFVLAGCAHVRHSDVSATRSIASERPALTVESFQFISRGTTLADVTKKLGAPDRDDVANGIHQYVYWLTDGSEIWIGAPVDSTIITDVMLNSVTHGWGLLFENFFEKPK
jgi:hypothetical protein